MYNIKSIFECFLSLKFKFKNDIYAYAHAYISGLYLKRKREVLTRLCNTF